MEWEYNGIKFPNKRVEYIYDVKLKDNDVCLKGLEEEFSNADKLGWFLFEELKELKQTERSMELFRKSKEIIL